MTKSLEKAVSLLSVVKHFKGWDCSNFIGCLIDEGIYTLCQIIHYVLTGELTLSKHVRGKLGTKIGSHLSDFKKLSNYPCNSRDTCKKKRILQGDGIIGVFNCYCQHCNTFYHPTYNKMKKQNDAVSTMFLVPKRIYYAVRETVSGEDKLNQLNRLNNDTNYLDKATQFRQQKSFKLRRN